MVEDAIKRQPATCAADIRAKAIEEFAEAMKAKAENLETSISVFGGNEGQIICTTVDEIAEQLKGDAE